MKKWGRRIAVGSMIALGVYAPYKSYDMVRDAQYEQELQEELSEVSEKSLEDIFEEDEIDYLASHGVPVEYVSTLIEEDFDGRSIYRFAQLDMDLEDILEFDDTDKPNAVIIYPDYDFNGSFEAHFFLSDIGYLPDAFSFFDAVEKDYDLWVRIADVEDDAYEAMQEIEDIDLLVLSGHGMSSVIRFGGDGDDKLLMAEEYMLDVNDYELGYYLSNVSEDGVIFLNSCANARGGENVMNLANCVSDLAPGRTVIAAKDSFSPFDVDLRSAHPFDIRIYTFPWFGTDVTYKVVDGEEQELDD